MDRWLVDTDVAIDYLKGRAEAVDFLEGRSGEFLISAITVAELYAGVRDGSERAVLDAFVSAFMVVPVDVDQARSGGLFRRDFLRSHSVGIADALIAAAARSAGARLVTLNKKHFPMLTDVLIPYQKVK
jgi:predicted nucleic acid-binding protein